VETLTDETSCAFDENWMRRAGQQAETTVFSSRRSRTYVFLGREPAVFALAMVAGSGGREWWCSQFFFYVRLKKVNKRGKIASSWHGVEKLRPPHKLTAFGLARAENATTHQLERHNLGSYRLD